MAILKTLPSLVDIPIAPEEHFTVCGDVHGQFYDLLNIFSLNGMPSAANPYLFNGGSSGCCTRYIPAYTTDGQGWMQESLLAPTCGVSNALVVCVWSAWNPSTLSILVFNQEC